MLILLTSFCLVGCIGVLFAIRRLRISEKRLERISATRPSAKLKKRFNTIGAWIIAGQVSAAVFLMPLGVVVTRVCNDWMDESRESQSQVPLDSPVVSHSSQATFKPSVGESNPERINRVPISVTRLAEDPPVVRLLLCAEKKFRGSGAATRPGSDVLLYLTNLVRQAPDDPCLWFMKSFALLACSEYDQSTDCINQALTLRPTDEEVDFILELITLWSEPGIDLASWRNSALKANPGKTYGVELVNMLARALASGV